LPLRAALSLPLAAGYAPLRLRVDVYTRLRFDTPLMPLRRDTHTILSRRCAIFAMLARCRAKDMMLSALFTRAMPLDILFYCYARCLLR